MTPLQIWSAAIQSAEGWYKGSRSYTNNNPGNISYAAAVQWSMAGLIGGDNGPFVNLAIFDNYNDGLAGLETYLTQACSGTWALYPPGTTFLQFTNLYAGNPSSTYINSIATALGINTNTIISTILSGSSSTQGPAIPPLNPADLVVTPAVITLGASTAGGPYYKFVVQQNSYTRTWVRYNNSNGILGTSGIYMNMIDNGPGTNEFDFTIICRNWDSTSLPVASGVSPTWKEQKIQIESIYGQTGTAHTFLDPFGQQPHQGNYPGVYITKLEETIDPSSTPDSPCTTYSITLLQAPPGVIVDTPTSQIPPPVSGDLLALPIITLGKADVSSYNFFAVQQTQYTRTWTRYNNSQPIPGSPTYISYVDYGPGLNEYDVKIICKTWSPGSLLYEYGVTQTWAQQKALLENMYNDANTVHFFLDPFGQYPTQDPLKGVYITKFEETIDPSSTPDSPCTYYSLTLLQTPPGPTIG